MANRTSQGNVVAGYRLDHDAALIRKPQDLAPHTGELRHTWWGQPRLAPHRTALHKNRHTSSAVWISSGSRMGMSEYSPWVIVSTLVTAASDDLPVTPLYKFCGQGRASGEPCAALHHAQRA
jgi:hypothetical protein